jgi:hypothetical protein
MRITSETPYDTTRVRGVLLPLLVVHGVRLLIGGAGIASLSAIHRPRRDCESVCHSPAAAAAVGFHSDRRWLVSSRSCCVSGST